MFGKTFVINLPFKTDRLQSFVTSVPRCFGDVEVWRAVHGDTVQHPDWWTAGRGAWGCYRSHLQILEYCYNANIDSYVVFEDDAIFRPNCENRLDSFVKHLPPDWEQVYLGGQLLHETTHPPRIVNDHVFIPFNVNRTHAFAVHRRGYEKLYKHLNATPFANGEHIDHHLGRLHESGELKLYCPDKWLVGQDSGPSNISGNHNAATFWVDPARLADSTRIWTWRSIPAIYLEAPIDVAIELERLGWHRGHWQNERHLDRGVCEAIASLDVKTGLANWYRAVMPEAVREGKACVCLYHPSLHWDCVKSLPIDRPFIRIVADTAEAAQQQLSDPSLPLSQTPPLPLSKAKRNLLYHIWPKRGNGTWQWNVQQLLKRIGQFDGVRSIGIVTDDQSDSLEDVQKAFGDVRIDNWLTFANEPDKGEGLTFTKLLETILPDDSITFRAHAKGVKYDDPNQVREWAEMLYEICLDDPSHVDATLDQFAACGPFLVQSDWPKPDRWHFSGSFYWFKSSAIANVHISQTEDNYWTSELWPQSIWEQNQVGILFGQGCANMYEQQELNRMKNWFQEWREQRWKAANSAETADS